jgi:signal transduction histidine kinase
VIKVGLRTRIALVVAAVAAAFSAAGYVFQHRFIYEQFVDIEHRAAVDDLSRCEDAVDGEMKHLATLCADLAAREDVCRRITDGDAAVGAARRTDGPTAGERCDAVWLVAADGTVRAAQIKDSAADAAQALPTAAGSRFAPNHPLLRPRPFDTSASGIVRTPRGPLLVASSQVVRSDRSAPAVGWLICGRLLTPAMLKVLADRTHVRFEAWDVDDPARDPASARVLADAPAAEDARAPWVEDAGGDTIHVFGRLDDVYGRPAVLLRADVPRTISARGRESMAIAAFSVVAAGLGMVLVLLVLLGVTIVAPLRRLSDHAVRVGRTDDLGARSGIVRGDEIGTLAGAFDEMVERLHESRARLTEAARRAGVADMARGLLHNVGNLLTSAKMSASLIAASHRDSRAEGLVRACELVAEHERDLARFLTQDERGRLLPAYLVQAAAACRQERAELDHEIERLRTALEHAAQIVARQSDFASAHAPTDKTDLESVVSGALTIVEPSLRLHGVSIDRRIEAGCDFVVDRMKLAQVLVNLLTNANEAMAESDPARRRLSVRAYSRDGRVRIEFEDTGCGIDAENLPHVFESVFSTKGRTRGMGLHYCSVAAREMGGAIEVASDGKDRGATFTVVLPRTAPAQSAPSAAPAAVGAGA